MKYFCLFFASVFVSLALTEAGMFFKHKKNKHHDESESAFERGFRLGLHLAKKNCEPEHRHSYHHHDYHHNHDNHHDKHHNHDYHHREDHHRPVNTQLTKIKLIPVFQVKEHQMVTSWPIDVPMILGNHNFAQMQTSTEAPMAAMKAQMDQSVSQRNHYQSTDDIKQNGNRANMDQTKMPVVLEPSVEQNEFNKHLNNQQQYFEQAEEKSSEEESNEDQEGFVKTEENEGQENEEEESKKKLTIGGHFGTLIFEGKNNDSEEKK